MSEWKSVIFFSVKNGRTRVANGGEGDRGGGGGEGKKYYPVIIIVTCAREKLRASATSAKVYYNDGDNNNIVGTTVQAEGGRSVGELARLYHDE